MSIPNPFHKAAALDEVLLDVATLIELSPHDRKVAESRYRRLKTHLERRGSPLAQYLVDGVSLIYAQGSVATSTTIISGTDDDRFDVDAIVEIDVPPDWDNSRALDLLEDSLQGFPGVTKIVRCTRCVQLQFPFMHMDVTILDRRQRLAVARAGEIFHSPDTGLASRVPSNPWGFTDWFRKQVRAGQELFTETLRRHRSTVSQNRLRYLDEEERLVVAKADQQELPPAIPNLIDAQEAVALKLLKRYLNLHYENSTLPRPPSIYLTKRAGSAGYEPLGLTVQLYVLAESTAKILRQHLANGTRPEENNPSYPPDRINDRWPRPNAAGLADTKELAEALEHLGARLEFMEKASLTDIANTIDELFGERVGKEQRAILKERYDRRGRAAPVLSEPRTGGIYAPAVAVASEQMREVPRHNFHPFILGEVKGEKDEE
ncbi:nucleotidyltransferase domain-containing protein [Methylocystis sp.]|uniref:nucleotidyltransferase domain-containing protein n=1 Tax=Methylocystis sp. TaxID=1911079 RepID=UPI003DA3B5F4